MEFDTYLKKYGLKESHIYLLELIPLVEMIWADQKNQDAELKILLRFTIEHLSNIGANTGGLEVISEEDVNLFFEKVVYNKPDQQLLDDLRLLCMTVIQKRADSSELQDTKQKILDYCMDIAAACAESYPYKFNARVVSTEKALIKSLIKELNVV